MEYIREHKKLRNDNKSLSFKIVLKIYYNIFLKYFVFPVKIAIIKTIGIVGVEISFSELKDGVERLFSSLELLELLKKNFDQVEWLVEETFD